MKGIQIFSHRHIRCLLCILLCMTLFPLPAAAGETDSKIVRVGWYEDSAYYITSANGERSGYGYEYQQTLAGYTGWTYEYVKADWPDLLQMLENGEIDLMGGVSYTEERAKEMLYSDLPMGEEKYYLYADLAHTDISASDLTSLNGKRIGMLEESIPTKLFCEWEQKHDLHTEHVVINSGEDAREKLAAQKIDGFISVESPQWEESGMSAFAAFGSSGIYYVINPERPDLKEEIDNAMRKMESDKPFYTDELYQRYLSAKTVETLSSDEQDWLAQHGPIRIGYLYNDPSVSTFNPVTGEMEGVITDYIMYAADCLSNQTLEFDLRGYATRQEQFEALNAGEIDMIFHVSQNPYAAEQNDYVLSNTVWAFNLAALTTKDRFDENAVNRIAVTKDNFALQRYVSYNYPKWKIVEYDTNEQAYEAAKKGEVDCYVTGSSQVTKYMKDHRFHVVFLTQPGNTSFAVRQGDTVLLSILNKTLRAMPTAMLSGALSMYDHTHEKVTVVDFIKDNLLGVTLILVGVFAVILLLILSILKKTKESARQMLVFNQELEEKQQELQLALQKAEKANEAKTKFLNNMSHDIRTPINGIIGMLTIIRNSGDDPERIQDCLNKINASSKLLLTLVNDVLDMAKLETDAVILNNESINVDELCMEIAETLVFQAEAAGISVTEEHDDYQGLYVWGSALHLKKVLMNLFTNAIKYNKPGGSIHTSMRTLDRSEDRITCEFRIADTGLGMSQDFVEKQLFQPFAQADNSPRSKYVGIGLGMPIVKQIVEKMGGSISVESKPGEGSYFTVVLTFEIDHEGMHKQVESAENADITGMHLLVAEDNDLNMEIVEFMLTSNGAQVQAVKNGQEALDAFQAAGEGTYDAILMDVMMPVLDGLTATRRIRALERPDAKRIPIIAMTANAFREDAEKCLDAGMNEHLVKPLDIEKVRQTLYRQVKCKNEE